MTPTTYVDLNMKVKRLFIRAVANAVGANPLPIQIPCHRVIASDGTLGGYSLGTKLKIKLLKLEGSYSKILT